MADGKNRFGAMMQVLKQESNGVEATTASSTEATPIVLWVPLGKIHRDSGQERRYFDPEELSKMARSMESVGNIDPLTVRLRPGTTDEYDLLAGEKRHRAGEIAKLEQMLVRVFDVDDRTAEDIKTISNLQRSDLNKWEETNAIMRMLCRHLEKPQDEVIRLLNQAANQERGLTSNVVRKEEWAVVEEVFSLSGRLTPESFRKHRLPLLKLPTSIQSVLQQGKLHYTKVNEILKIKDQQQQDRLLQEAISGELSVDAIQTKVKEFKQQSQAERSELDFAKEIPQRLTTLTRQLKQAKIWNNPSKRKKLERLLAQLDELLIDKSSDK